MVRKENSRREKSLSRWTDFMTRLGGEGGRSGGWTMGEMEKRRPKVLGRTQRRSFPGFPPVLNYRAGRLRASAQRHHTNQKTWGVSSSHQNDRGKVESGPFESEGRGPGGNIGDVRIARRQRGKYLPGRGSQKCRRSVGGKTSFATGYQNDEEEMDLGQLVRR